MRTVTKLGVFLNFESVYIVRAYKCIGDISIELWTVRNVFIWDLTSMLQFCSVFSVFSSQRRKLYRIAFAWSFHVEVARSCWWFFWLKLAAVSWLRPVWSGWNWSENGVFVTSDQQVIGVCVLHVDVGVVSESCDVIAGDVIRGETMITSASNPRAWILPGTGRTQSCACRLITIFFKATTLNEVQICFVWKWQKGVIAGVGWGY